MELYQGKFRIESARATWYNYNEGLYFITICTAEKKHFFGEIKNDVIHLTKIGKYTENCIHQIEERHPHVMVPYSVVMPNHVHLMISIVPDDQNDAMDSQNLETPQCDVSTGDDITIKDAKRQDIANHCGKLSHLISQFKSAVTKYAKQNHFEFGWQSRFHDHIIKNPNEIQKIADYILNNVYKWDTDCFNENNQ